MKTLLKTTFLNNESNQLDSSVIQLIFNHSTNPSKFVRIFLFTTQSKMDVLKCKPKHPKNIVQTSTAQQDKLRRRREINARYSRLSLSKTIQHFQSQGHVTISISEKFNGKFCCMVK